MMLRTLTAAFVLATTMSACASPGNDTGPVAPTQDTSMRTLATGQSASMAQGETVRLPDGGTLSYQTVAQDSRCPPKAQCIRAGDADIAFVYTTPGGSEVPVQPNLPEAPTKPIGAMTLTVEQLAFGDAPAVTVRIDAQ
jgi:hypothetical protein